MQLSPSIFKAYDIRGIVPSTVHAQMALALGRAFGTLAMRQGETTVAVGRDGRLSGPLLAGALMQGLQDAGLQVIACVIDAESKTRGDPKIFVLIRKRRSEH